MARRGRQGSQSRPGHMKFLWANGLSTTYGRSSMPYIHLSSEQTEIGQRKARIGLEIDPRGHLLVTLERRVLCCPCLTR